MSTEITDSAASLTSLAPEEVQTARKILHRLEFELLEKALKRLKGFLYTCAALLFLFGAATFATIRTAVVEAAANKLAANRAIWIEVAKAVTPRPIDPPRAAASSKYNFESGAMAWTPQDAANVRACTSVSASETRPHTGVRSLELAMSMDGSDPTRQQGEAYVELRDRSGTGELQTADLSGRTLVAWIYAPPGSRGASDAPNGVQLFVKDAQFRSLYSTWQNVAEGTWNAVSLPVSKPQAGSYIDRGFDSAHAVMIGVKFAAGGGSRATYNGPLFVDDVNW